MPRSLLRTVTGTAALLLLAVTLQPLAGTGNAQGTTPPVPPIVCQAFPQTAMRVCGRFLQYWQSHGGVAQQGYPISSEFNEVSDTNGKTYTVQYFERAVFEYHPENQPPGDVLLSLLGVSSYKERYANGAPGQEPNNSTGSVFFPETGHRLGGVFLDYWRNHGGLMQQGYPISDEFTEKSELDGNMYRVQYFQRAVFELHPANQSPYNVLLSQLGTFQFKHKYPNGQGQSNTLAKGIWGGLHASIQVGDNGTAKLEFDCAHGAIDTAVVLDPNGHFDVLGTYTFEHGGPVSIDDPADTHPAHYVGTVTGNTLSVTITVTMPAGPMAVGTFTVQLGAQPRVVKCV